MDRLHDRQAELIGIVQAIDSILKSEDWQYLEEKLWKPRVETLNRQILTEATKKDILVSELYYLNGRRDEAKKYANLQEFGQSQVRELEAIKQKLQ